jgi:hypothetical protein
LEGWSRFDCLEIDGTHLDLDPAWCERITSKTSRFPHGPETHCGETGCDYHPLPTDQPIGDALAWYLQRRSARLKQT